MYQNQLLSILIILIFFTGCYESKQDLSAVAEDYYATYAQREDLDYFMSFYSDTATLKDYISGDQIVGKAALMDFFDWDNPNFQLSDSVALVVNRLIVSENHIVASGYFTSFEWGGSSYESMQFISILTLNSVNKIILHEDWINYPNNLLDYSNRKNSNNWLK